MTARISKPAERRATVAVPANRRDKLQLSLTLLGLCVFTLSVVTGRFPVAEAGIAIGALGLLLRPATIQVPRLVWLLMALVAWAFLTSFSADWPALARAKVVDLLKTVLILLVVVNGPRSRGQLRFFLVFLLLCFLVYPARGAILNYAHGYTEFGRTAWNYIYSNPNDLAALSMLALGVAVAIAATSTMHKKIRLAMAIGAGVIVIVILLTQSRGAFIGLIVAFGPATGRIVMGRRRGLAYGLVAALVIALLIPAGAWTRLGGIRQLTSTSTIAAADPEGSAAQRWEVQKTAWRIFTDRPITGVGLGGYALASARYAPALGSRDTHNTYLNLAAELGLPGLLLWCGLVLSVLRYAKRARVQPAGGTYDFQQVWIERGLVGFLVAGLFGTYWALTLLYLILGVLWCSSTMRMGEGAVDPKAARARRA